MTTGCTVGGQDCTGRAVGSCVSRQYAPVKYGNVDWLDSNFEKRAVWAWRFCVTCLLLVTWRVTRREDIFWRRMTPRPIIFLQNRGTWLRISDSYSVAPRSIILYILIDKIIKPLISRGSFETAGAHLGRGHFLAEPDATFDHESHT